MSLENQSKFDLFDDGEGGDLMNQYKRTTQMDGTQIGKPSKGASR